MRYVLGIDWGTYNSAAAAFDGEQTRIIESKEGTTEYGKAFPSFLYFDLRGEVQAYGIAAMRYRAIAPKQVIWGVKRLIGLSYDDAVRRKELKRFAFKVEKASDGGVLVSVGERKFTPTDLCEIMLRKIKTDAESPLNLGIPVEKAQLGIPSYFDDTRAQEIVEAAKRVGFESVKTIIEPTAASIAHGAEASEDQYVLAISMGAGTFEAVAGILTRSSSGNDPTFMAKGIAGDPALGGIDIDDRVAEYLLSNKVKREVRDELESSQEFQAGLLEEAERIKIALSSRIECQIYLQYHGRPVLHGTCTRTELESAARPILERCRGPIETALTKADLKREDIDAVFLIGGPMYMPIVRDYLQNLLAFDGQQIVNPAIYETFRSIAEVGFKVDPMQCVALGAARSLDVSIAIEPTPYGYGCEFPQIKEAKPDGSALLRIEYKPVIEADTWQNEGTVQYRITTMTSRGIGQDEFKLIAAYKVWNRDRDELEFAYRELGIYTLSYPRATPVLKYTLRRDPENRRVDLIVRHPEINEEWVFHKVHSRTGTERKFPEEHRIRIGYPASRDSPSATGAATATQPSPVVDEMGLRREMTSKISALERLCANLVTEARVMLGMRSVSNGDRPMLESQLSKMRREIDQSGGMRSITEDRHVKLTNQALALVHDLEVTQPPLLDSSSANEWRRKILNPT